MNRRRMALWVMVLLTVGSTFFAISARGEKKGSDKIIITNLEDVGRDYEIAHNFLAVSHQGSWGHSQKINFPGSAPV